MEKESEQKKRGEKHSRPSPHSPFSLLCLTERATAQFFFFPEPAHAATPSSSLSLWQAGPAQRVSSSSSINAGDTRLKRRFQSGVTGHPSSPDLAYKVRLLSLFHFPHFAHHHAARLLRNLSPDLALSPPYSSRHRRLRTAAPLLFGLPVSPLSGASSQPFLFLLRAQEHHLDDHRSRRVFSQTLPSQRTTPGYVDHPIVTASTSFTSYALPWSPRTTTSLNSTKTRAAGRRLAILR